MTTGEDGIEHSFFIRSECNPLGAGKKNFYAYVQCKYFDQPVFLYRQIRSLRGLDKLGRFSAILVVITVVTSEVVTSCLLLAHKAHYENKVSTLNGKHLFLLEANVFPLE